MPSAAFFLLVRIRKNDTRKKPKLTLFLKNLEIEFSKKVELGAFGPVRSIGNTVTLSEQTAAGKMGIISQFALDSDQLQGMTNRQRAFVFRGETAQNRNCQRAI